MRIWNAPAVVLYQFSRHFPACLLPITSPQGTALQSGNACKSVLRGTAVPDGLGGFRIDGVHPPLLPVEGPSCVGHFVIQIPCVGDLFGDVRSMGCDPGGDNALLHILYIGQSQMLGGSHLTQEGSAADGIGDVVITGSNVRDNGAQHIEGSAHADSLLNLHVGSNLIHLCCHTNLLDTVWHFSWTSVLANE